MLNRQVHVTGYYISQLSLSLNYCMELWKTFLDRPLADLSQCQFRQYPVKRNEIYTVFFRIDTWVRRPNCERVPHLKFKKYQYLLI